MQILNQPYFGQFGDLMVAERRPSNASTSIVVENPEQLLDRIVVQPAMRPMSGPTIWTPQPSQTAFEDWIHGAACARQLFQALNGEPVTAINVPLIRFRRPIHVGSAVELSWRRTADYRWAGQLSRQGEQHVSMVVVFPPHAPSRKMSPVLHTPTFELVVAMLEAVSASNIAVPHDRHLVWSQMTDLTCLDLGAIETGPLEARIIGSDRNSDSFIDDDRPVRCAEISLNGKRVAKAKCEFVFLSRTATPANTPGSQATLRTK